MSSYKFLKRYLRVVSYSFILFASITVYSEERNLTVHPITVAYESALRQSPKIISLTEKANEIESRVINADLWRADALRGYTKYESDSLSGSDSDSQKEIELGLSIPFWFPTQRALRQETANSDRALFRIESVIEKLALAEQVRALFWQSLIAAQRVEQWQIHLKNLQETANLVNKKKQAGELALSDFLLAKQRVKQAQILSQKAQIEFNKTAASFTILTGLDAPTQSLLPLEKNNKQSHPELAFKETQLTQIKKEIEQLQAGGGYSPELGVSVRQESEKLTPDKQVVGFELNIPFGVDMATKPAQLGLQTQQKQLQAEYAQLKLALLEKQKAAQKNLSLQKQSLDDAREQFTLSQQHLELVKRAFELGELGLIDFLRAQAMLHDSSAVQAEEQANLGWALSNLNQSKGVLP